MIASDVTAVIPLYNKVETIESALESIWNQGLRPIATIVVDDGSTDGSAERVAALNREDILLVRQANAGPGSARNHGLRLAKTPYVAFLDADDLWLPDHVAMLMALTSSFPGHALYANRLGIHGSFESQPRETKDAELVPDYAASWLDGLVVSTCAAMVDRSIALECGGFATDENRGEDLALWLKLTLDRPMVMGSDIGALYRREASDLTRRPAERPDAAMLWIEEKIAASTTLSPHQRQKLAHFRSRLALLHAAEWIRFGGRQNAKMFLALVADQEFDRAMFWRLRLLAGPLWPLRSIVIALRRLFLTHR